MLVGNNFLHVCGYAPHARFGCTDGACVIYVIFAQLAGSIHFFFGDQSIDQSYSIGYCFDQ